MKVRNTLLAGPLGFGAAPLGNMFRNIPDNEAEETVDAAWEMGTRYYDTAPFYGAGLSEIRLGKALAKHKRNEYVLSSKVGRIILDQTESKPQEFGEKGDLFKYGRPNKIIYDYSADGVLRSISDSLKRLGVDRLDFVWIHDVARDFHGDEWTAQFEIARKGAFRALTRLRDEGSIKAWGLGVNRVEPCELAMDETEFRPDALLLAGRYSLLDHELALQRLMPAAAAKNVDIVIGGPYSSGVLAGGTNFEYRPASPEILDKFNRIKAVADRYEVPIKAAALQFSLAHPASAAIIPGASKPSRIAEDHAAVKATIPDDFWLEMRKEGLVAAQAPLPTDRKKKASKAQASASIDIRVPPETIWKLIGGFGSLPDWLPYIPKSELSEGGRVRHLADPNGHAIVERLEAFNDDARSYSYSILQAPFPVTGYLSTLRVLATDGGNCSRVEWSGQFLPKGVSDGEASLLFQGIFEDGLKALAGRFASQQKKSA
jgi:D-threo-aldose 1-dehydrogenase